MPDAVSLAAAPLATPLHLTGTPGESSLRRRLQAQGLRAGSTFSVVRRTAGGGLIIAVAGARVALGRDLAASLRVEVRA